MLSALFPIQTNSLISFHEHSSVLLHQCTTLKALLTVLSSVDTIDNALHRHPDIPRADIPPPPKQPQVYTALLHQYSITYRRMQTS